MLPVADPWFVAEQVDHGLTRITEPHVDGWLRANTWHLRGRDRDLLVDCGLGVGSLQHYLQEHLAGREPVVVLTHAHLDHMGSAHEFAQVWAHPAEPTEVPGRGTLLGRDLAQVLEVAEPALLEEQSPLPTVLLDALPDPGYDPGHYRLHPVRPTRALTDSDVVDLGDRRLQVLHLPGHTPGSIALLETDTGRIFTGDVVYDDELIDYAGGSDIADYVASMRRLLDLPITTVHAGHGPSFGPDRLHEVAQAYLDRRAT